MKKKIFVPLEGMSKKSTVIIGITSFIIIFAIWELLTRLQLVDTLFLPTPENTVMTGIDLFLKQGFVHDILVTVGRVMAGFLIAAVVAIPLGILIGVYAPVSAALDPVLSFLRYLPASAFIPLFILWIGIDEEEKIAVIILGSISQLILMIAQSTREISKSLIEVSYTLGTRRTNVIWKVILPKTMPSIVDTLRIVLGWAWTYIIVAELVGASSGIGYMIIQSQRMLNTARIFVGILTIGVIGLVVDLIFKWLNRRLFPWNIQ